SRWRRRSPARGGAGGSRCDRRPRPVTMGPRAARLPRRARKLALDPGLLRRPRRGARDMPELFSRLFAARPLTQVLRDLFDIVIVAWVIYRALLVLRGTRAIQM